MPLAPGRASSGGFFVCILASRLTLIFVLVDAPQAIVYNHSILSIITSFCCAH